MKKIFQYLMVLSLSLMVTSCYYDDNAAEVAAAGSNPTPANVSFSNDIQPIFTANCASCHKGSLDPNLSVGNSYAAITANNKYVIPANAANSLLYKTFIGQGAPLMPPDGALSAAKIKLVENWINAGALNN